jgi:hypothetical protein
VNFILFAHLLFTASSAQPHPKDSALAMVAMVAVFA